jgi:hypothetical protein
MTARIQCSGITKRFDASVTKAAKRSMHTAFAQCVANGARPACVAPVNSIDAATIAATHAILPRDRNAAIVLAAVKGKALTRQPDGRP